MPQKTLQTTSRNFVIPAGTQVVLKTNLPVVTDNDHAPPQIKKPGSVGVVIQCPPHNDQPYQVQFSDETIVEARFDQLVLQRQEISDHLLDATTDYRPYIAYRCQVGSKAFGLATDDSDDDLRGFFIPPADKHWSLYDIPEQIELKSENKDEVYWELEKFLRLALKANPNILETLWTPHVIEATPIAQRIRDSRQCFLSKHLYKTYSGYVLSQFRRMKNRYEKTGKYKPKHAMHLLRLLYSGIGALKTGNIMIDVSEHRKQLMAVREGQYDFETIRQQALELDRELQRMFESTTLPEQPDFESINQLLIDARRSML